MRATENFKLFLNGKEVTEQEIRDCKGNMSVTINGLSVFYSFSPKILKHLKEYNFSEDYFKSLLKIYSGELNLVEKDENNHDRLFDKSLLQDFINYRPQSKIAEKDVKLEEKCEDLDFKINPIKPEKTFTYILKLKTTLSEKDKTEKLVFTTLEKELTSEKQQGHLSTRHKKPAPMYLDEALADIATKKLETEKSKFIPGAIYKQDDKGTFNLVSKPSKKFKKEQVKIDKVEDKYKPTDCILDEIHTGVFTEKEEKIKETVFSEFIKKCLTIKGFNPSEGSWNYTTPIYAKKIKTEKTLVDLFDKIDSKKYNTDYTQKEIDRVSGIAMESLQRPIDSNFSKASYQEPQKIGIKNNKNKPSLDIVINKQFPKALQLIALATEYGHKCYKENDDDFLNYKSVEGGAQVYFDANARHSVDRNGIDESGLPHIIHAVWSSLAGLELWAEENNVNIKEFSENYMKNLHTK